MKSRSVNFSVDALEHLKFFIKTAPRLATKITEFLEECARTPFEGKGKPEPLKGNYSGYWSRRINEEHRLIYRVDDQFVYVLSCRGHYD